MSLHKKSCSGILLGMTSATQRKSLIRKEPLTEAQEGLLKAIRAYIEEKGFPPTRVELAGILKVESPTGVHQMMQILQRKGYIEIAQGTARGIRLL